MNDTIKTIFLFSLPRSGSTLVQRVLGAHPKIGTRAEPWILLSLLGSMQGDGFYSWANNHLIRKAVQEFWETLPNGAATYRHHLKNFVTGLYAASLSPSQTHFLDKTPRYYLIVDDIVNCFDNARFVFLWRNPLAVVSSIVDTWAAGKWKLFPYEIDLYAGIQNLTSAYKFDRDCMHAVNYENLINGTEALWLEIFEFLNIDMPANLWNGFMETTITGSMGDLRARSIDQLQTDSVDKWKNTFYNSYRKRWARNYLNWIGDQRLKIMGYNKHELLAALDSIPTSGKNIASDIFFSLAGQIAKYTEIRLVLERLRRSAKNQRSYPIFPNESGNKKAFRQTTKDSE
jgi:hypothetical protein